LECEEEGFFPRAVDIVFFKEYTLEIELDDHRKMIYNMKLSLESVHSCRLADMKQFNSVTADSGNTVVWDNQCQITVHERIQIVKDENSRF
jgi:hypothetical protein